MEIGNGFPRPCVSPTTPQLKRLAWQVHGAETLRPAEALDIYERNWRHVDKAALQAHERALIDALRHGVGARIERV